MGRSKQQVKTRKKVIETWPETYLDSRVLLKKVSVSIQINGTQRPLVRPAKQSGLSLSVEQNNLRENRASALRKGRKAFMIIAIIPQRI